MYQTALAELREKNRKNDFIIARGNTEIMNNLKNWTFKSVYSALEAILFENDRLEQMKNKNPL